MTRTHIKYALLFSQTFLCIILLAFYHYSWSGFSLGTFTGLIALITLGAFYRPRWAFWFFVGLLPFEALSLTEGILPISLRPYQIVGGVLFFSVMANIIIGRTKLRLPDFSVLDGFVVLIPLGGLVGAFFANDPALSFRLWVILSTFVGMYVVTRVFVTKLSHLRMPVKFLGVSVVIVSLYGILQNITFLYRDVTTAVMPGRPNATFSEADWFGMFLVFATAICISLVLYLVMNMSYKNSDKRWYYMTVLSCVQVVIFVALILSVARSAWVGLVGVVMVTILCLVWVRAFQTLRILVVFFGGSIVLAYGIVALTGLSRFDLSNRAQSTGSGLQEITVACLPSSTCSESTCNVPPIVESLTELSDVGCRFINLEDIELQKMEGMIVTTTTRPDPNIEIRKKIFSNSWKQIKEHPIAGIGWGSIGEILGTDGSGTSLNSSNLFLQVWLGSGLLGIVGLVGIITQLILRSVNFFRTRNIGSSSKRYVSVFAYTSFILLGGVAIIVPNLFNAGLLTGFIWVFLGCTQINLSSKNNN